MNLRVPQNTGTFLSSCTNGSFSRRAQLHEWILRNYRNIYALGIFAHLLHIIVL
jgi:hypothetical protein